MFTGIIEEKGKLIEKQIHGNSGSLRIAASKVLENTKIGDSIAVNGVCLTVTTLGDGFFTADVMAETIRRSSLGSLMPGAHINLERAMAADGRFGGHIVSGHIDGTGEIASMTKEENATLITVKADSQILNLIVEKGSITIDGISLTVASVSRGGFYSFHNSSHRGCDNLDGEKSWDQVNLENDLVGKYVQKLLGISHESNSDSTDSHITLEMLESLEY